MTPGAHIGLDAHLYHAAPGVSASMLRELRRSPAHLQTYLAGRRDSTPAMLRGELSHYAAEGALLGQRSRFAIKPEGMSFAKKDGIAWKAEMLSAGLEIVPEATWNAAMVIGARVAEVCPIWEHAREVGGCEVSLFAHLDGLDQRCRIDCAPPGKDYLLDLKTCQDARADAFARAIATSGYHIQAAQYLAVWNAVHPDDQRTGFVFVAVESTAPHAAKVWELGSESLAAGFRERERLLRIYAECMAANDWPAYDPTPETLEVPKWALAA